MMISEFIERTGFEPTASEYAKIEKAYYGWFTRGDCKAYDKFLNMPYDAKGTQRNITTKLLYSMARTIMQYSDPETYDIIEVAGIMYSLGQICDTTFYVSEV